MQQPAPYVDFADEKSYFNVEQASKLVSGVCQKTLWTWASRGITSFGFPLTVKIEPVVHHRTPRTTEAPPKHPKQARMLILADDVLKLKEILQDAGRKRPGPWDSDEVTRLKSAMRRNRIAYDLCHQ